MVGPPAPASTPVAVGALLSKLSDPDPDFRFMALNDLHSIFTSHKGDWLAHEYNISARTLDCLVKALDDSVGEVQNLAVRCLEPFIHRVHQTLIAPTLEKLSTLKLHNSVDNSVVSMSVRAVVSALPKPVPGAPITPPISQAYNAISRVLIPRLVGRLVQDQFLTTISLPPPPKNALLGANDMPNLDTLEILIEIVHCFGSMMSAAEVASLLEMTVRLVEEGSVTMAIKKRAVVAISLMAPYVSDDLLSTFLDRIALKSQPRFSSATRRYSFSVIGALSRTIPLRLTSYLQRFVPLIMSALSEEELQHQLALVAEDDAGDPQFGDVREAALITLESLLASCPNEMRPFTESSISACLRYVKYDPNYAQDDDDEMEEDEDGEFCDDEDNFDEDGGFDNDDDDPSWKVRRCAVKTLYTIISTRSSGDLLDNGILYRVAAPALIKRFDEREESVRLEVIATTALLIRKTGEGVVPAGSTDDDNQLELLTKLPHSRKRRRQSSTAGRLALNTSIGARAAALSGTEVVSPEADKLPPYGPRDDLMKVTPALIKAVSKQLQGKVIGTKQAVISLLNDLVIVQRSLVSGYFEQLVQHIIDAIKMAEPSSSSISFTGAMSATPSTLRITALQLTGSIARTHSSNVLQPHLSDLVDACVTAVNDKFFKISSEAFKAIEELVKAITPPRSSLTCHKYQADLLRLFDVLCQYSDSSGADAEVRQRAIHGLGTLLSRTSNQDGAVLIHSEKRKACLNSLLDRLKNETTRPAAVKAISSIAALSSPAVPLDRSWAQPVALELADQLRKTNRLVRSSSIHALTHLVQAPGVRGNLDVESVSGLTTLLLPVLGGNDSLLIAPTATILARLAEIAPQVVATPQMTSTLCEVLQGSVSTVALDGILLLVTYVGRSGHGDGLLNKILKDVSVKGDPAAVGKVIGTLLVSSPLAQISIQDFIQEVSRSRTADPVRASLALSVLGEAGLRLESKNPIEPSYFIEQFGTEPDKFSVAAALAMGRACAGNVPKFLPVMLEATQNGGHVEYLLLQAIKETLQILSAPQSTGKYGMYWKSVWDKLLSAARSEDNRPACAECMGRLALVEPGVYIKAIEVG